MALPLIAFRMAPEVMAEVDRLAAEAGTNRSEVIRRALALLIATEVDQHAPEARAVA